MRIDLHTHSTASDGTLTPAELVEAAAAVGLDVVGITDHDTTTGWEPAAAARPAGLTLIPGAELSCRWYGEGSTIALHLLAYLFDPTEPALAERLADMRRDRLGRAERMVNLMRADGIDVTWEEILRYAEGGTIGRPHLAQALIRRGMADTVSEAFGPELLGRRYRLPKRDLDVFEAIRLVRAAGGATVFAHPKAAKRGRVVPDEVIVQMAAAGLDGLEADHEDHSPDEVAQVAALAAELGLVATGSSDFHGGNKTVRLGAHTTDPEAFERIVAAASGYAPVR
jgi:predicted metal-dependent phosphoesterase TrpH